MTGGTARRWGLAAALVGVVAGPMLAGCSDRMLDTGAFGYVTGDGPPPDAPTTIRPMTGEKQTYPNLATVPPRPTDVPTLQQREQDIEMLQRTRNANQDRARTVREDDRLPVQPVPVPPPADITPGKSSRPTP